MDKNENVCRICLEHEVTLNWNEELLEFCGVTYKDCYYLCTQLDETDADSFSAMLCKTCSEELKSAHFLIKKALESFRILQQTFVDDCIIDEELEDSSKAIKENGNDFEICSVSQSIETIIEHDDIKELGKVRDIGAEAETINVVETYLDDVVEIHLDDVCEFQPSLSLECVELKVDKLDSSKLNKYRNEKSLIRRKSTRKTSDKRDELDANEQSSSSIDNISKSKQNKRVMCAYCSIIVQDIYQLRKHEETHDKNRERKEVCPHCGLKFYNKMSLKCHMLIHKEKREKKHKCEFCDKAYFNRGALNVHRRIHLGLMIKCKLCPKEFYQQQQLDRHVAIHSIIPKSQVKTSKYVVHCKDCNSQIPSIRWNAHKAIHKNEPQVKCKICNRDFFSRQNCTKHIRRMHKKTGDEYEKYIHYYVDKSIMRTSHLMLQQCEIIQPVSSLDSISS